MSFEYYIAKRIQKGGATHTSASPAIRIAIIGMTIAMVVMILSVAIVIGFKSEVQRKVVGFGADIQVTQLTDNDSFEIPPISPTNGFIDSLKHQPEVQHVDRFITKPGLIKTESEFEGVVIKGIDPQYNLSFISQNLVKGSIPDYTNEENSTQVIISRKLSQKLQLDCGDSFLIYFLQDQVKVRKLHIEGVYETHFEDYDNLFIIGNLHLLQTLNEWSESQISGLEIMVKDFSKVEKTTEQMLYGYSDKSDQNGNPYYFRSIKERTPEIFIWLDVLDTNVWILIILMIAVSGFSMIAGVLIIILERVNMIGVLQSLGATNKSIRKIFIYITAHLIGKGMLWGNIIGIGICLLQQSTHLFKLNPEYYFIDAVPIELNLWMVLLINVGTFIVTLMMIIFPTKIITRIQPSQTMNYE